MSVFGHSRSFFEQKIDPKLPRSHFFSKRIHQNKFKLKIPIFSKSNDDATWWPNSYKKNLTCGQLRNIQRYQKCVQLVRAFFLEFPTCSSQQWNVFIIEESRNEKLFILMYIFCCEFMEQKLKLYGSKFDTKSAKKFKNLNIISSHKL